jgi:hypothetical protein
MRSVPACSKTLVLDPGPTPTGKRGMRKNSQACGSPRDGRKAIGWKPRNAFPGNGTSSRTARTRVAPGRAFMGARRSTVVSALGSDGCVGSCVLSMLFSDSVCFQLGWTASCMYLEASGQASVYVCQRYGPPYQPGKHNYTGSLCNLLAAKF